LVIYELTAQRHPLYGVYPLLTLFRELFKHVIQKLLENAELYYLRLPSVSSRSARFLTSFGM